MQARLREIAATFLGRNDAVCFIGWEWAPGERETRPFFARRPDQVDRLIWNDRCHPNPATYLPKYREREGVVGIAVKGCDARSLRELLRSNQVVREKIFVLGIPCAGLVDGDGSPASRCAGCNYPHDFEYDATLGKMATPDTRSIPPTPSLEGMSQEERRAFWQGELDKCIRCDACRRICYGCFCPTCIFESGDPKWISGRKDTAEKLFYHAVRAYHLAGRCTGCGECARACPTGVRLDIINLALRSGMAQDFAFEGVGVRDEVPPLLTFSADDPDPFTGGKR